MPTVNLSPIGGAASQFLDSNGVILSGGKLYTYAAGTTTPQVTYTSVAGTTPHANPIILDSAGRVPGGEIWLTKGLVYKFTIETSASILIGTYDNISGINDFSSITPVIFNANGNGSQVAFSLASAPLSENTTNVYINGVYQQKNTYTVAGVTVTFSAAPPFTSTIEISYF
jgi:hypothetical protein